MEAADGHRQKTRASGRGTSWYRAPLR